MTDVRGTYIHDAIDSLRKADGNSNDAAAGEALCNVMQLGLALVLDSVVANERIAASLERLARLKAASMTEMQLHKAGARL